ncbi:unnamed protein product [Meganyctiphanes norvegica]|uniref:Carbonic anhydrase n=1 Tax=Meganyctiphanes norvegica TaxID=48144 RepID=A0AAV2RCQ7_MEGNR
MNPCILNILCLMVCIFSQVRGRVHYGYGRGKEHWGYHGEGNYDPEDWSEEYKSCGGKMQSPINIDTCDTIWDHFDHFSFHHYKQTPVHIENNGHTLKLEVDYRNHPRIKGGGLEGIYDFANLHFHWGSNSSLGSEHSIDGKFYPMEAHLVHYKSEYKDVDTAVLHPDGLAVLSVLFEVTPKDNKFLAPILKSLNKVEKAQTDEDITSSVPLRALLPRNHNKYFRYSGSLTTPTCNEAVIWTVFTTPVHISEEQLEMFRRLRTLNDSIPLTDNFRPLQEVNSRRIYRVERELELKNAIGAKIGYGGQGVDH